MRESKSNKHPKEQEDAIIVPHVICKSLYEKRKDACKHTETNQSVGHIVSGSAKAEGALRKEKQEYEECDKRDDACFHNDL